MATKNNDSDNGDGKKKEGPGGPFTSIVVAYHEDKKSSKITLPAINGKPMTLDQGIYWLKTIKEDEERVVTFDYKFRGWYPFDAMWALYRALNDMYGHTSVRGFPSWWGEVPPTLVTIQIGYGETTQIPWGPLMVSGLSTTITPSIELDQGMPVLALNANIKQRERKVADEIVKNAETLLLTSSIYRGKAVEVDFQIFDPRDFRFDVSRAPKFMDVSMKDQDLVLSKDVEAEIDATLWTPIRSSELCIEHKIPLRRSTLLAGPYGVGKTLAARLTAKICQENGWTFLYLKDLNQLPLALAFAKRYQRCAVFVEDINRVVQGQRTAAMDTLLNVMDGIDRKTDEVMTIFTTNEIEKIHPAMLRPGRMDSIVIVTPPDAEAVERLVRLYGRSMVLPGEDLTAVGQLLKGQIPAIIGEAVERAKLAAIRDAKPGEALRVRAEHLLIAGRSMLNHAKLLQDPPAAKPDMTLLGEAIGSVITKGFQVAMAQEDECGEVEHVLEHGRQHAVDVKSTPVKAIMDKAGRPNGKRDGQPASE